VSNGATRDASIGFADIEERVHAIEQQADAAGISLRETAKWIISGIAVAAAGVIAGTSLSSLGALDIGGRLYAAISAAIVGFIGLAYLFASALKVITPPSLTLRDVVDGREISDRWKQEIEQRTRPLLNEALSTIIAINTLKEFTEF
jgi:hypothetical protein